ncbi:MAG: pyruvate ferredoxin oxidoreductase [Candidatus Schekmanbacteria bacterium]|nr:MAG: pyruvate ferredoxin oxidoreductase [Candidatus Schekmanbacteria bacterium]
MASLKELSKKQDLLSPGHRLCAGCGVSIVVRQVMLATENPTVVACATGCLEVATTIFPYTAWRVPFIHNAFENAAATISGVEAMYNALVKKGKIPKDKRIDFIAFGGDGGTYDIGLQSLSGALERGHRFLYVCYNNEAYMNTGIQRSSATPYGAHTTTGPAGDVSFGKKQDRKDLTQIVAAHKIPYAAQASPSHWNDLVTKVKKALNCGGPSFINVIANCNRGWRNDTGKAVEVCRVAVQTCYWPLYEIENGKLKINVKPKEKKPIEEWLKYQGRFSHLKRPENRHVIDEIQQIIDRDWERLLTLEKAHQSQ